MNADEKKSILDMAMGGIKERVDLEMSKIVDNIIDPNTAATKKRTLTVAIDFLPDDKRQNIQVKVTAKSKLEPTTPLATSLYMGANADGELEAVELTPIAPGQIDIYGEEQPQPAKLRMVK